MGGQLRLEPAQGHAGNVYGHSAGTGRRHPQRARPSLAAADGGGAMGDRLEEGGCPSRRSWRFSAQMPSRKVGGGLVEPM